MGGRMNTIKFSHDYWKLPVGAINGGIAKLLYVQKIKLEEQTTFFLNYDTTIRQKDELGHAFYPLPDKGDYLLLLFDCDGTIFTTLRRYTEEKSLYYLNNIGNYFQMVIE